jgi:hypothetical protein
VAGLAVGSAVATGVFAIDTTSASASAPDPFDGFGSSGFFGSGGSSDPGGFSLPDSFGGGGNPLDDTFNGLVDDFFGSSGLTAPRTGSTSPSTSGGGVSEATLEDETSATDEATDSTPTEEEESGTTDSDSIEAVPGSPHEGTFPTVGPGGAACSQPLCVRTPDLERKSYVVTWKGNSSGGVPAWRLEFYHGSYPINTKINTADWTRVDGSGDRNPVEKYAIRSADLGRDGRLNWRMCVRNLGANDLTGGWQLDTTITDK